MTLFNPDSARTNNAANSIAARALDGASLKTLSSANFNALQKGNGLDVQLNPDLLGLTVARAGPAWNPNWTGISGDRVGRLVEYAPNRVRSGDHGVVKETAAATNRVQNPRMEGGDPGTLTGGSPSGTLPSRMALDAQGATVEFIGYAVTAGRTEALFRFSGTPTGDPILYFEPAATAIASATTNTRTGQATVRLAAGALTNTAGVAVRVQELTSAGANVTGGSSAFILPDANQRGIFNARTLSGGGTVARARHGIIIDHTSGAIDLTLAVSFPQFESGLVATTPVLPPPGEPGEFTRAAETFTFGAFETVRASRETYRNADGSITNFLPNTVAYGTDGIQVTDGSTNLWTRSEDFNDAAWTKSSSISITKNVARAPDGEMTANRATIGAGTFQFHRISQNFSATSGTPYTASFFLAYDGSHRYVQLTGSTPAFGSGFFNLDLVTGEITNQSAGDSTGFVARAERVGRYIRVSFTAQAVSAGVTFIGVYPITSPSAARFPLETYPGSQSFLIWGGQIEAKRFMSPYIKTGAATVARAASLITTRGFFVPDQPFALVADMDLLGLSPSGFPRAWALGTNENNKAALTITESTGVITLTSRDGGTIRSIIASGSGVAVMGARLRTVSIMRPGAHRLAINGALIGSSADATALSYGEDQKFSIGSEHNFSGFPTGFVGHGLFREMAYIPFGDPSFPDTDAKVIDLSAL